MSVTVGLFEAKTNLGRFVKRAARGEEIIITDRGSPVARLGPAGAGEEGRALREAWERFQRVRRKAVLNPPGTAKLDVKTLKEEGRR